MSVQDTASRSLPRFSAFDRLRNVDAGSVVAAVPLNGQTEQALGSADNRQYRVLLKAAKRELPKPVV